MRGSKQLIAMSLGIWTFLSWNIGSLAGDREISVPVAPGTDVVVGFGELPPGPHILKITLKATSNYVITESLWYDPSGDHIWMPKKITSVAQEHIYTAYGVFSNDAHAIRFRGFLKRLAGEGPPPEFYVAVGDIDLDIDSDNNSTTSPRSPSETQEEDEAEYVGSTDIPSEKYGMKMSSGDPWAAIKIKTHVKKACKLIVGVPSPCLNLKSPQWQFADSNFDSLMPREKCDLEGCGITVYEAQLEPHEPSASREYEWTLYIKPDPTHGKEGDVIVIAAGLIDPKRYSPSLPVPLDRVVVWNSNWSVGGSSAIVIVDADGVYNDPEARAKLKKLVIRPPSSLPPDTRFRLKRTYPEGQPPKIRVFYPDEQGLLHEVTFTEDWSDRVFSVRKAGNGALCETFFLRGMPVPLGKDDNPWSAASEFASQHYEDQGIEVYLLDEDGRPQKSPVAKAKQTALWVSLAIDITGKIPPDNEAIVAARFEELGPFGFDTDGMEAGIGYAVTLRGMVHPPDMVSRFRMKRLINGVRFWEKPNETLTRLGGASNQQDDSWDALVDEDPQSGGSQGKIYDVYFPCISSDFFQHRQNDPAGTKLAVRFNFTQWVEWKGERCSERFPWRVALAIEKTQNGTWAKYQPNPEKPDNIAGRGHIPLGWDLQEFEPFIVSLEPWPRTGKDGTKFEFTAIWKGTPNFDYVYHMRFNNANPWSGGQDDVPNQKTSFISPPLETSKSLFENGQHMLRFGVAQRKDQRIDQVDTFVYTNQEPRVKIKWEFQERRTLILKVEYVDPDKDPMKESIWQIIYYDSDGKKLKTDIAKGDSLNVQIPDINPSPRFADIVFECLDQFNNKGWDAVRVVIP